MNDLGFDAVAGDKSPAFAVEEAGPDFAIGKVDKDGLVGVGRVGGGLPVDGGFHFCKFIYLLILFIKLVLISIIRSRIRLGRLPGSRR